MVSHGYKTTFATGTVAGSSVLDETGSVSCTILILLVAAGFYSRMLSVARGRALRPLSQLPGYQAQLPAAAIRQ